MAVKPIENMPMPRSKPTSQAQMVRDDLKEAFEKRISQFELEGEYNYKTLGTLVRQEIRNYFWSNISYPAVRAVKEELKDEFAGMRIVVPDRGFYEERGFVVVKTIKMEDRPHVFVKIYFDAIDNYKDKLLADTRDLMRKRQENKG